MPRFVKQVPAGYVAIPYNHYGAYAGNDVPIVEVGVTFYAPNWGHRLINEWPIGFVSGVPTYMHHDLLAATARAITRGLFDDPDEGINATLSALQLGGPDAAWGLIWEDGRSV